MAGGRPRRLRRQRDQRRFARGGCGDLRRQHARGRRRRAATAARRLQACAGPRSRRPRADRPRGARQHDGERDERRHHALDLRRRSGLVLRLGVAPVVDRRRHGRPHRGAAADGVVRDPSAARSCPDPRRPRAAPAPGRLELARLPRRLLALSAPRVSVAGLGDASLPAARVGHQQLHRRCDRSRRGRDRSDSHRRQRPDRRRSDPRGAPGRSQRGHAHARRRARRASRDRGAARARARCPCGGAGGSPDRQLGVGDRREPAQLVGRALPTVWARSPVDRRNAGVLPRARSPRRPRRGRTRRRARDGGMGGRSRSTIGSSCLRARSDGFTPVAG